MVQERGFLELRANKKAQPLGWADLDFPGAIQLYGVYGLCYSAAIKHVVLDQGVLRERAVAG